MAAATAELKVVVGIVQESQNQITSLLNNLGQILTNLKALGSVSLDKIKEQIKSVADSAKIASEELHAIPATEALPTPHLEDAVSQLAGPKPEVGDIPGVGATGEVTLGTEGAKSGLADLNTGLLALIESLKTAGKEGHDSLKHVGEGADEAREKIEKQKESVGGLLGEFKEAIKFFLELEAVEQIKDIADVAARSQELGTVLQVVGNRAGYSNEQLEQIDKTVQRLGITVTASRQSLLQMVQAGLNLDQAPKLARAAQDLAVVSASDSSQTFQRLVTGIQTMNTEVLHSAGLIVNADIAYQKFGDTINKAPGSLTTAERQQALFNESIRQADTLAGSYEAAMGNVGKQIRSLTRYEDDLKDTLGEGLLPAYLALIQQTTLLLQNLKLIAEAYNSTSDDGKGLAEVVNEIAGSIRVAIEFVAKHYDGIKYLLRVYLEYKAALLGVKGLKWGFDLAGAGLTGVATLINATREVYKFIAGKKELAKATEAVAAAETKEAVARTAGSASSIWKFLRQDIQETITAIIAATKRTWEYITAKLALETAAKGVAAAETAEAIATGTTTKLGFLTAAIGAVKTAWAGVLTTIGLIASSTGLVIAGLATLAGIALNVGHSADIIAHKTLDRVNPNGASEYNKKTYGTSEKKESKSEGGSKEESTEDSKEIKEFKKKNLNERLDILLADNERVQQLSSRYTEVQRTESAATQEEINTAKEQLQKAKEEHELLELAHEKTLIREQYKDPARIKKEEENLAKNRQTTANRKLLDDTKDAERQMFGGSMFFNDATGEQNSAGFKKFYDGFAKELEAVDKLPDLAKTGSAKLKLAMQEMGDAAKTPNDLQNVKDAAEKYKKATGDIRTAQVAIATASLGLQEYQLSQSSKVDQNYRERQKTELDSLREKKEYELDITKLFNSSQDSLDKAKYDAGLIQLDTYFARRKQRLQEEGEKEVELEKQILANLKKQAVAPGLTPNERLQARLEVTKQENKITQLEGTPAQNGRPAVTGQVEQRVQQVDLDKETEQRELNDRIVQLKAQAQTIEEGEPGRIAEINAKYEVMERGLKQVPGASEALNTIRQDEIKKLVQADQNQVFQLKNTTDQFFDGNISKIADINRKYDELQIKLKGIKVNVGGELIDSSKIIEDARAMEIFKNSIDHANESLKYETDLKSAQAEQNQQALDTAVANGVIDINEAMKAGNDILLERMNIIREQLDSNKQLIAQYEAQAAALKKAGDTSALEGVTNQITQLKTHSVELNTQLISLGSQIQTYGLKVQKSFTEGIAKGMADAITQAKSAQQSFLDMLKNWRDQIVTNVTQVYAQRIADQIKKATTRPVKDKDGNAVMVKNPDTGKLEPKTENIFDKLGGLYEILTGKKQKDEKPKIYGDRPDNPLWVKLADNAKNQANQTTGGTERVPSPEEQDENPASTPPFIDPARAKHYQEKVEREQRSASEQMEKVFEKTVVPDTSNPGGDRPSLLQRGNAPTEVEPITTEVDPFFGPLPSAPAYSGVEGEDATPTKTQNPLQSLFEKLPQPPAYQDDKKPNVEQIGNKVTQAIQKGLSGGVASSIQAITAAIASAGGNSPWMGSGGLSSGLAAAGSSLLQQAFPGQQVTNYGEGEVSNDNFYADGGVVNGPGTGKSDDIPAKLSNGEFVVTAEKTRDHLPLLQAINNGYAEGGLVHHVASFINRTSKNISNFAEGGLVGAKNFVSEVAHFAEGGLVGTTNFIKDIAHFANGGIVGVKNFTKNISHFSEGGLAGMPFQIPAFADGGVVNYDAVQSIAPTPLIMPSDKLRGSLEDQASAVKTSMSSNVLMQLHPDMLKMNLRDFMEKEVARQFSRRD